MTRYFRTGTKDDESVYLEVRTEPDGPVVVGIDLTSDEAEAIGQSLVNKARYLKGAKR
jgi:hypothetical protein